MSARRVAVALLMTALLITGAASAAAPAEAAARHRLCASHANLRDSPDGFVIGRLRTPQRLTVLRRSANRRWTHVRVQSGLSGWLPSGSVCRRG